MPTTAPTSATSLRDAAAPHGRAPTTAALPPVVDAVLARHRAEVTDRARGRVLVVAGSVPALLDGVGDGATSVDRTDGPLAVAAGRHDPLALPTDVPAPPAPGRVYDTIVSVGGLLTEPDLPAALVALDALLAPGGRLLLVDSTRSWRRVVELLGAVSGWPGAGHLHLQRDLVGALWAHGFAPLAVERFTVPTLVLPLRPWGHVIAARPEEISSGVWA